MAVGDRRGDGEKRREAPLELEYDSWKHTTYASVSFCMIAVKTMVEAVGGPMLGTRTNTRLDGCWVLR